MKRSDIEQHKLLLVCTCCCSIESLCDFSIWFIFSLILDSWYWKSALSSVSYKQNVKPALNKHKSINKGSVVTCQCPPCGLSPEWFGPFAAGVSLVTTLPPSTGWWEWSCPCLQNPSTEWWSYWWMKSMKSLAMSQQTHYTNPPSLFTYLSPFDGFNSSFGFFFGVSFWIEDDLWLKGRMKQTFYTLNRKNSNMCTLYWGVTCLPLLPKSLLLFRT